MRKRIIDIISILLIVLFGYAAITKGNNISLFKDQMMESPMLPIPLISIIAYLIPLAELLIVVFIIFDKTRLLAFYSSYFIMLLFSLYLIALKMLFGDNIPCACGGILGQIGYNSHIVFNLFFTIISGIGIILDRPTNTFKEN